MTKKQKRIVMYLAAFLVALALVSICLVGNTFARFVSSDTGSTTAEIAKWSLTDDNLDGDNTITIDSTKLSPDDSEYTGSTRSHDTGAQKLFTITNASDVDAIVSITVTDTAISFGYQSTYTNSVFTAGENSYTYTEAQALALFTIVLCDSTGNTVYDSSYTTTSTNYGVQGVTTTSTTTTLQVKLEDNEGSTNSYIVYGKIVWTTNDTDVTYGSTYTGGVSSSVWADTLDTLVGKYVSTVKFSVSYSAVQGSKLPE